MSSATLSTAPVGLQFGVTNEKSESDSVSEESDGVLVTGGVWVDMWLYPLNKSLVDVEASAIWRPGALLLVCLDREDLFLFLPLDEGCGFSSQEGPATGESARAPWLWMRPGSSSSDSELESTVGMPLASIALARISAKNR